MLLAFTHVQPVRISGMQAKPAFHGAVHISAAPQRGKLREKDPVWNTRFLLRVHNTAGLSCSVKLVKWAAAGHVRFCDHQLIFHRL